MKLKMLASISGPDLALSMGDETDRFDDVEGQRLIDAGFAEKAAIIPARKPVSKAEWDDERNKLLDERAKEQAEYEMFKAREGDLLKTIDDLNAFKASVASIVGAIPATAETTDAQSAAETPAAATGGETTDKVKVSEIR